MSTQSNQRYSQIGLDRVVRLHWLERTAYLVLAGMETPTMKPTLQKELARAFRSANTETRGSLDKTITILMKIWVRPTRELDSLRRRGLKLFSCLPGEEHIALHWGMTMAVYPFWGAVAAHLGRLLRLQGTVTASQVQRRLREQYGERETVSRRVRYILRSFIDWKVLKETSEKGIYTSGNSLAVTRVELIAWLVEAFLHARRNNSVSLEMALDAPCLFPFRFGYVPAARLEEASDKLEALRFGLDQEVIMLRSSDNKGSL